MYIIIKRDRAEELKHKLHKMKMFTEELLESIDNAPHHSGEGIDHEYARRRAMMPETHYPEHEIYDDTYDHHMYDHEFARGRGRGRMGRY